MQINGGPLQYFASHPDALTYAIILWISFFIGLAIFFSRRFRGLKLGVKLVLVTLTPLLLYIVLKAV